MQSKITQVTVDSHHYSTRTFLLSSLESSSPMQEIATYPASAKQRTIQTNTSLRMLFRRSVNYLYKKRCSSLSIIEYSHYGINNK